MVDVFAENCYFLIDEESQHGFVIDPGAEPAALMDVIRQQGWTIEKILLTHGHIDHIGAVETLHQRLGIPYLIHERGKRYLTNLEWNLCAYCNRRFYLPDATYLKDGQLVRLEANPQFFVQAMYTPGHTQDSMTYYCPTEHAAFVGDTLFKNCPGSTQYHGSSPADLQKSIARILSLPADTRLYSGHSGVTTVEAERQNYF